MLPTFGPDYSLAHRCAFHRYKAAGFQLTPLADADLHALLEDPEFFEEVARERARRAQATPFQRPADAGWLKTLQAHIAWLAAQPLAVRIVTIPAESAARRLVPDGQAGIDEREIRIPPIEDERTYATALHELGHVRTWERTVPDRIARETSAWVWAYGAALHWTHVSEIHMATCLASYLESKEHATHPRTIVAAEQFIRLRRNEKRIEFS
jgi:hypothetical protein